MGGRMAMDAPGTLWITYYKWQKNAQGISRDKEIFVRTLKNETLSKELRVSPTDVPSYEDHTDPAIALVGDKTLVSWSWDYHRPRGYTQEPESPTIFLRTVDADLTLGKPFHASGRSIDMVPVLAAQGKVAWCAWDSLILRVTPSARAFRCAAEMPRAAIPRPFRLRRTSNTSAAPALP